ncbi:hypothetical protein [Lysinibacter cavernae]|uniref:Uncharacterized protein n=1 Tax=Lysinibacter cavernae TaxID=1640652 RepID=A0A7X5QZK3_9MICO|nr:hypothetical protein [Lysinibacter cavernae]NIH52682.1 hypothetical protein [Lysinibacter cavernae]
MHKRLLVTAQIPTASHLMSGRKDRAICYFVRIRHVRGHPHSDLRVPQRGGVHELRRMLSGMGMTAESFARSGMIAVSVDDKSKLESVRALIG